MNDKLKRDWFNGGLRERAPVVVFLLAFQSLYFPINSYLADKGGFVADIPVIDGNMPLLPAFVVIYGLGLGLMPIFPIFAAWKFPRDLFQRYMVSWFVIMCIGFTIWLVFPAYVIKEPIQGSGLFIDLNKMLHRGDDSYGTHNAIPSSHVYYVTIAMCYHILYSRRLLIPFGVFAVLNALSTMFTHQHYFLDVLAGFLLTLIVYELTDHFFIPQLRQVEIRYKLITDS